VLQIAVKVHTGLNPGSRVVDKVGAVMFALTAKKKLLPSRITEQDSEHVSAPALVPEGAEEQAGDDFGQRLPATSRISPL
jgi:hypothetical protein